MREAADLEDASEKHVAMENRLYPMRELLGYMLLELKQPKKALVDIANMKRSFPLTHLTDTFDQLLMTAHAEFLIHRLH